MTHSPDAAQSGRKSVVPIFVLSFVLFFGAVALTSKLLSDLIFDDYSAHNATLYDLQQLSVALEAFKAKYKVYPPSSVLLSNDPRDYADDPQSLYYLNAIWPRLNLNARKIDWSGGVPGFKSAKLEGDQCLVFFLSGPNQNGFSTNPMNPTDPGEQRVRPFFEFAFFRLIKRVPENPFPSFQDGYHKNVYAYFSSGRDGKYRADPSLKVRPYQQKGKDPAKMFMPKSFQIISAGKDGIFGPGGAWEPASAAQDVGPNGLDDLANFHKGFLGQP